MVLAITLWLIGAIFTLLGCALVQSDCGDGMIHKRQIAGIVVLALLWPLPVMLIALGMLLDLARFLLDVARKPH